MKRASQQNGIYNVVSNLCVCVCVLFVIHSQEASINETVPDKVNEKREERIANKMNGLSSRSFECQIIT